MSVAHGIPKSGVWKLCLAEKFCLLKHFKHDSYIYNLMPQTADCDYY